MASTTGKRSAVRDAASVCRASAAFCRPNSAFLRFSTRPPSLTPRALATASGALVRSEIARRSSSEVAVRDTSRAWPYQAAASIRVAIDGATRPAQLLTIHGYWADVLLRAATGFLVLADTENLVTNAWLRLYENSFLLRAPGVTVPVLREACASAWTGWRKIGAVLTAACDAVPASVPVKLQE